MSYLHGSIQLLLARHGWLSAADVALHLRRDLKIMPSRANVACALRDLRRAGRITYAQRAGRNLYRLNLREREV